MKFNKDDIHRYISESRRDSPNQHSEQDVRSRIPIKIDQDDQDRKTQNQSNLIEAN